MLLFKSMLPDYLSSKLVAGGRSVDTVVDLVDVSFAG